MYLCSSNTGENYTAEVTQLKFALKNFVITAKNQFSIFCQIKITLLKVDCKNAALKQFQFGFGLHLFIYGAPYSSWNFMSELHIKIGIS